MRRGSLVFRLVVLLQDPKHGLLFCFVLFVGGSQTIDVLEYVCPIYKNGLTKLVSWFGL